MEHGFRASGGPAFAAWALMGFSVALETTVLKELGVLDANASAVVAAKVQIYSNTAGVAEFVACHLIGQHGVRCMDTVGDAPVQEGARNQAP